MPEHRSPEEILMSTTRLDGPARHFIADMYDGVLQSNFTLKAYTYRTADFSECVADETLFRTFIHQCVMDLGRGRPPRTPEAQVLLTTYIDRYEAGSIGAYAWAVWFYRFDEDNWFTFNQVHAKIEAYLSGEANMELRLFKGFENAGVLAQPVTVTDLPVVVNHTDQTITLWTGSLAD